MEIVEYSTTDSTGLVSGIDGITTFRLYLKKINNKMVYGTLGVIGNKQAAGNNFSVEFPAEFRPQSLKPASQVFLLAGTNGGTGTLIVQGSGCSIYRSDLASIADNLVINLGLNTATGGGVSFFYFLD